MRDITTRKDLGLALGVDLSNITDGVTVGNNVTTGPTIYGGSGVPAAGLGNNGDYYYRTDTPQTVTQRIYVKSAGSWIATAA